MPFTSPLRSAPASGLPTILDSQLSIDADHLQNFIPPDQQPYTPPLVPRATTQPSATYPGSPQVATKTQQHTSPHSFRQPPSASKSATRGRRSSGRGRFASRSFIGKPKRSDQGPMPSSADIYPEDAILPNIPYHGGTYVDQHSGGFDRSSRMSRTLSMPKENLLVQDATVWPTPAEAKTDKPIVRASSLSLGAVHPTGTRGDEKHRDEAHAAKITVTARGNIPSPLNLPRISTRHSGTPTLIPDSRPLTPGQVDGKRYGLRFFGLGIKDEWAPPIVKKTTSMHVGDHSDSSWSFVPFRTRPRLHHGWGGWEWAHKQGWYVSDE